MSKWVEVDIEKLIQDHKEGKAPEHEIVIEDDPSSSEEDTKKVATENTQDDVKEEPSKEDNQDTSSDNTDGEVKESRAQKRIRELANQRRFEREARLKAEQELEETRKEVLELRKQSKSQVKINVKDKIETKKAALNAIKQNYKDALAANDFDKAADLQAEMTRYQVDIVALEAVNQDSSFDETQEKEEKPAPKEKPKVESNNEIPEAAQNWAEANPWFREDQKKARRALVYAQEILDEGKLNMEDPEFFDTLDSRLSEDPLFGTKTKEKSKAKTSPVGSGSQSAPSKDTNSRPKVTLSRSEVELAESMGIPVELYAANKLAIEKGNGKGWTPAITSKKSA